MKLSLLKYCPIKLGKITATAGVYLAMTLSIFAQSGFFISPDAVVNFTPSTTVYIGNDLTIGTGAYLTQQSDGKVYLAGNFTNNGGFFTTIATFIMNGIADQTIGGTTSSAFYILSINKTTGQIELNITGRINSSLRLITNTIFDLNSNDLIVAPDAKIYSDDGLTDSYDSFTATKCIVNSGSSTDPLAGAYLIKEISPSASLPLDLNFPITTPGRFSPLKISLLGGGATFSTNPYVKVKPVPLEHPQVETQNVSLIKYWVVKTQGVTVNSQGANIQGNYESAEVKGSEGNYIPLVYAPNYNSVNAYWRLNPGLTNSVDFNAHKWFSQKVNFLDGDWTVGDPSAGQATYFARADGDWNDVNTWSKSYFDGVVSTTIPNKRSDRIRIQNHTVTITTPIAEANLISLETGTEGRKSGILKISNELVCKGDSFKIQPDARIYIANTSGISDASGTAGAIQTLSRTFSPNAIYYYWGGQTQITGMGLPTTIQTIVVDKTAGSAVSLSQNTSITDSVFINEGILDLAASTLNGQSAGKKLHMLGGELIVRNSFPTNYTSPVFNFGQVTFDGTSSLIPAFASTPPVAQYNKLFIKGTRSGNITFDPNGEIKIIDELNVSGLSFTSNAIGFTTAGSTVRFAKNGGTQNISFTPAAPPNDAAVTLKFYNVIFDSTGTKAIANSNSLLTFTVNHNLTISNSAIFQQNNYDIELQGNWLNQLGTFSPTAGRQVTMNSTVPTQTITITSRNTTDNPFQNLTIQGLGIVSPKDNLKVLGNVVLKDTSNFTVTRTLTDPLVDLYLSGNWTNNGGTFTHTNSTAYFEGSATQYITKTISSSETFYNLVLNNSKHLNSNAIGSNSTFGLIISNNLALNRGRINARDRFVQVGGTITRITTIPNEGYINSRLRRNIPNVNNSERTYEVGYEESYTPITVKFLQNSVATAGILQFYSDTITTTTLPVSWSDGTPSSISPLGSKISPSKHIARQWTIETPVTSTFQIAANGKYQLTPYFRGQAAPNGDLRNAMNPMLCDASLHNPSPLNTWIYPRFYPPNYKEPDVLNRSNDSLTYGNLQHFGSLIIGEPSTLTFFTRATGNWNVASNWSLVYYNGPTATEYPGQTKQNYIAYIGAGYEITLESNRNVIDSVGLEGYVAVDSSGVLNCGTNNIYGTGGFRMLKNSTIKMQDPEGITTAPTATGNVRTTIRNYNYNTNNSGTFIYNRIGAQNSGNGLPSGTDSINVIIADNSNGTLTLNVGSTSIPINIKDSLYIKSSNLNSGVNNITLAGNLRIEGSSAYTHNNKTFSFTGVRDSQLVTAPGNLAFYNLNLSKNKNLSYVKLLPTPTGTSYNIQVANNLNFEANNRGYINLSPTYTINNEPNYNNGEWFMTMGPTATVTRTNIGHIDGELRKNIPASLDSNGIRFEIGNGPLYKPFKFYFTGTVIPGYVGAQSIPNLHKYAYYLDNVNFNLPTDRMFNNYWRITTPSGSTFNRNSREMGLQVGYTTQDIPGGTSIFCLDIAYWKGGTEDNWQGLFAPKGNGQNPPFQNNGSGEFCIDRKITGNIVYSPFATDTTTRATQISFALGNYSLPLSNNRILLADIIIGQQGPRLQQFYTRKSGNWLDPNTWSTVSYNGAAATSFPKEKLHIAHIGEGHVVTLDANIGNGINLAKNDGTMQYYEQCLGSVEVENTAGGAGYLKLGTFVIRTTVFKLHSGGILETGCADGFHIAENRGNIIQENRYIPISRDFNLNNHNNGNYVFEPAGIITTTHLNPDYVYCNIEGFQDHKARVASLEAATGSPYNPANVFANFQATESDTKGFIYLPNDVYWLTAGQQYTFRIHGGTNGGMKCTNMRAHLYIDWNFNGNYSDLGERLLYDTPFPDENCYIDVPVTVPSNTPQGTTQLRVIAGNGNIDDPCDQLGLGQSGGSVDFTVHISNPNYQTIHYTGAAIPAQIASITVNADSCGKYVEQNSDLSIKDSIKLEAGQYSTGNDTVTFATKLQGNLINNSGIEGLRSDIGGIEFNGIVDQYIRGTSPGTKMWNTILNNTGKSIILEHELTNRNLMTFQQDCKLDIELAKLYFDTTSQMISPGSGSFSASRMITSLGTTSSHSITKYFPSTFGASAIKEFLFPIGYSTNYNPVYMRDTITFGITRPTLTAQIVGEKHPELPLLSAHYLNIYWPVSSSNFSNIDNFKFYYNKIDITGDSLKFIPAIYTNGFWRFDVGINPSAAPSPINITSTHRINGDWAVFDSTIKNFGTIYFSRQNGAWDDKNSWSTDQVLRHQGPPSSYYPGQVFTADSVNIDGHTITFNIKEAKVDSLRIGGTNPLGPNGILLFSNLINGKELITRRLFLDDDNGAIDVFPGNTITDSISVYEGIMNNSRGVGIKTSDGSNHLLYFSYIGTDSSHIRGIGNWQNVSGIVINKYNGLSGTVYIDAPNFSKATRDITSFPKFTLYSGVLTSTSNELTYLSDNSHIVQIFPFAGLYATQLNCDFQTLSSLKNYPNSVMRLDDGCNVIIGDNSGENYYYDSGTEFQLVKGRFTVAGAFLRQNVNSQIVLNLDANGEIIVAKSGAIGTDIAFDLGNFNSTIAMNGGRIIVANGNNSALSDLLINASNPTINGISGGTIQIGDSTLTTSMNNFKIAGSTPLFNLHLVGNASSANIYTTSLAGAKFTVKNQVLIDPKQILDINGKILELHGDLLSYGELKATPIAATSDSWQIALTGDAVQNFKNFNASKSYLEIYNLSLDKTAGNLILGGSDIGIQNSSIKVNQNLEFLLANQSLIDAQTYSNKVILGPNGNSICQYQVIRSGLGHVYGTVSKFADGSKSLLYPVGANDINLYRPAEIESFGSANTNGYLEVTHYNSPHPDVVNSKLIPALTIPVYWTVSPSANQGFQLGSDGKYDITTTFINPGDYPSGSYPNYYEHSLHFPPYPPAATWKSPIFASRTATTVKSKDEVLWGDFIVGNPKITNFWSIADGPWDVINSWSNESYLGAPASRIPDKLNDVVHIGNGKTITLLDNGLNPTIKSVIIEKYNNLPGTFKMDGQSYVSGETFTLNDSCTLMLQNIDGISDAGLIGAVRTNIREFGISRYIYNSDNASQLTGTGLPVYVQSLIITNSSANTNKKVFLSNSSGAPAVNVVDSLFIEQGTFNSGNRNLRFLGNVVLDSVINDSEFEPLTAKVTFDSTNFHYLILKNRKGFTTFDVDLKGGNTLVTREGSKVTPATHHYIQNNLNFLAAGKMILGYGTNLIVTNPSSGAISNYGSDKFIQTSLTSGMLIRSVNSAASYFYPIGSNESAVDNYTPMNLTVNSVTTSGNLGVRVSPGSNPAPPGGGHLFVRTSAVSEYLKRFWMIDAVSGDFNASGRFYYVQNDVFGDETKYNRIGRWRPQNEGSPGSWIEWEDPNKDITANWFETKGIFNSSEYTGDWTLGNPFAFRRIFYSLASGNWSSPASWTESPTHNGAIFGAGLWPNMPTDSVQIGEFNLTPHEITLDVDATNKGTSLGTDLTNKGILNTNFHLIQGANFTMGPLSHLKITSPDGISLVGSLTGNIQSTDARTFSTNGIYEYSGNGNQIIGSGLPATLNTLIINNSGVYPVNIVTVDKNLSITKDLTITQGSLDLQSFTANNNSGTGTLTNSSLGRLIIGGSNNMLLAANNYSSYLIDVDSYTEFNGILDQNIYEMPLNFDLNLGLGNVDLNNGGIKYVSQFNSKQMLIRGNLRNFPPASLYVNPVDNTVRVLKNIVNQSYIKNEGVIDLGN